MSVIQQIRDKYARWAVIAIALSLLGFLLMDAFAGRTGLFSGGNDNTVGKINGRKIEAPDFSKKVKQAEDQARQQGYEPTTEQIVGQVWEQEVGQELLTTEFNKLGYKPGNKEVDDILYGEAPPQDIKRAFTDEKTGVFDAIKARQQVAAVRKQNPEQWDAYVEGLKMQRMISKYQALLAGTVFFPKWFLEKQNIDNSLQARVSYVSVPYSSVSDSAVKVTDSEIEDYVKDHESQYEQKEETRSISYVLFNAAPNGGDSNTARQALMALQPEFDSTKDYTGLIARTGSTFPFYDNYISGKTMQQPNKEAIINTPVGATYGPYLDAGPNGSVYAFSKVLGIKQRPDTVKVRHILVATVQRDPQSGQSFPIRTDSAARKLVDSIRTAWKSGTSFDTLVQKYSDDAGSKEKGGVYENVTQGQMVGAFSDYIFDHKTGESDTVKTEFGYHLIEILSQKGSSPAYKIAYLTQPITASQATEDAASNAANLFAGDSRDAKSFNANWEKNLRPKGINRQAALDLKPMDFSLQGVNAPARSFIKEVFDAGKGDVVGPLRVGSDYIVALVTDINEAGLATAAKARSTVEPVLRNRKKAEIIKKKIGTVSTLEAVAAKTGQQLQTADSVKFNGGGLLGFEPKIIGAAFYAANKGKVVMVPLEGTQGVYVIRVDATGTAPVAAASIEDQRRSLEMQAKQGMMYRSPVEALKKSATIKDNRAKFY